jgi:4,5-DOPA dioxygenase extradiol
MNEALSRFPVGFVAHGAPLLALNQSLGDPFRRWGESLPRPRAFLVVSAHFEQSPLTIGTTEPRELLYDFSGFPDALYRVRYSPPGAPRLADRVSQLLEGHEIHRSDRPLDHGVWTPLVHIAPDASVPVLEISMPRDYSAQDLFRTGRQLAALRDEGVWILASGNIVHNLGRLDWSGAGATPSWAAEFDAWSATVLARQDWDALIDYDNRAPALSLAHPSEEHFRPLLVAAGAAADDRVTFVFEGWEYGSISRRTVQFG